MTMILRTTLLILGISLAFARTGTAQEMVTFQSRDGVTTLTAHLHRPARSAPAPALVLLHGCSGLTRPDGVVTLLYRPWARMLAAEGYVVLLVDSAGPRGFGQTCTAGEPQRIARRDRPKDAYAALQFLQAQPFVRPDRIGVIGWSQGGGTVLYAIAAQSVSRPPGLAHDFRAAVAFYPGSCNDRRQSRPFSPAAPGTWTSTVPLMILFGAADNWTPIAPCENFAEAARARGAAIEFVRYPDALHAFDAPGVPRRERPEYRTPAGVVPLVGTDHEARADVFKRVPEFLVRHLRD